MSKTIKNRALYLLYLLFYAIFRMVPAALSKKIIDLLAFLVFKFYKRYYKISLANLNLVYGDKKSQEEKESIILNSYKTLGYNMYELLENQRLCKEEICQKMTIVNPEIIPNALKNGRKIIFITAHYGGWELTLPAMALYYDINVAVVNKKMQNPYIQKVYEESRRKNNITPIYKHSAAKEILKCLKDGDQVAVVIDQYSDDGCKVQFLGVEEVATNGVARLANKTNALIIPVLTTKNEFRKYEITVYEPIDPAKIEDEDKICTMTKLQNDIISAQIFKDPDPWLWQHKRFRTNHSDIYR